MSKTTNALAAAVAELAAEMPHDPASCPAAEELIGYHDGKLSAAEEARIQEHLLACPETRGLLLDLERLANGELGCERTVSELERAAVWKDLRSRIAAHDEAKVLTFSRRPARLPGARPPGAWPLAWVQAVAASLAIATLGLSAWVFTLRQRVEEMERPQLNAVVEDLYPGALRGGENALTVLRLGPEDQFFTLVLNPPRRPLAEKPDDEYVVEIVQSDGEPVWSGTGLRRNEYGSVQLRVTQRLLPAGDYRLRLSLSGVPRGEPVTEFALRIELESQAR